ncbi:hypothetical protein [Mesorhizobium sp. CAU 1732]
MSGAKLTAVNFGDGALARAAFRREISPAKNIYPPPSALLHPVREGERT